MKRNAFGQPILHPLIRTADDGGGSGGGDGKQYTPPSTQEELDKLITSRVSRATAKYSDYDDLKTKAAQWDAHDSDAKAKAAAAQTDEQKRDERLTAAEQRAQAAEDNANRLRQELLGERVQAAFKSASAGRSLTPDAVFAFDAKSFVKDGTVDAAAIKDWVEKNSTETDKPAPNRRMRGQGERSEASSGGSVQAGRDRFTELHKPSRKD